MVRLDVLRFIDVFLKERMMFRFLKKLLGPLMLGTCWATLTVAAPFTFTAIPDQDTARLQERFGQVATYLQQQLGVEVRYVPVKSYEASVSAFKNNEVQLAWFGGLSGVQARLAVPGSQAIALGEEDLEFVTYFIAHTGTGLSAEDSLPEALKGRTFTFGSKGSTSGRLMPEFFLRERFGQAPEQTFRRVGFSGDHSRTLQLVQAGSYEVGALNYKVWETEQAEGKVDPQKVRVIWRTPSYPDYNWSIRGDVDETWGPGFLKKVQQALVDLKDPAILQAFPRRSFLPATNEMFAPILQTAQDIGIIRR